MAESHRYPGTIDWSLFHLVNTGAATRDWIEDPLTAMNGFVVLVYALAAIGLWFASRPYGNRKWKLASTSALTSVGVAFLANQAISHIWSRPRPFVTHPGLTHLLAARSPDASFPSDHAAAAFAIAFAVLAFSRRGGILFLASATLIALSRIALGLHYPSDVVAGMCVGWVAALLVTRAGRPWIERLVTLLSRISDPVLLRMWNRLGLLLPSRR